MTPRQAAIAQVLDLITTGTEEATTRRRTAVGAEAKASATGELRALRELCGKVTKLALEQP